LGIFSNLNFIIVWKIIYQKEGIITGLQTPPPLWMDKNAKLAIINKQRAWRKYKYSRTRASYIDYALNRNSCTNIICNSKLS
jgi:hypothetical protein